MHAGNCVLYLFCSAWRSSDDSLLLTSSFLSTMSTTSQQNSVASLCMCAVGICACYLYYGMLQEELFSNAHMGASFLLLTQCISNSMVAITWQRVNDAIWSSGNEKSKTAARRGPLNHVLLLMSTCTHNMLRRT